MARQRYSLLVCIFLVLNGCFLPISTAHAQALDSPPDRSTADLLLVEISLNGQLLEDFQDVLLVDDQWMWLPIKSIVSAGEGSFSAEDDVYLIDFGAERASVSVDMSHKRLEVANNPLAWPDEHIIREQGRLFFSNKLVNKLFDINASFDTDTQRLALMSERPLPADLKAMRDRRWSQLGSGDTEQQDVYPKKVIGYSAWGTPRGSVKLSLSSLGALDDLQASYSAAMEVEAGFISNDIFISGNNRGGLRTLRWKGGRQSSSGGVFGIQPLHRLEFGDVPAFSLPLSGNVSSGRGIGFSTAPLQKSDLFDVTRLSGNAVPGWDAELYRGRQLIDFQRVSESGEYLFEDIPLTFGRNELRVVLYGPQGDVQEQTFERSIAGGQVIAGELHLRGSLVESRKRTLPISGERQQGNQVASLRADYGLTSRLTFSAFVGLEEQERSRIYTDEATLTATDEAPSIEDVRRNLGIAIRPIIGGIMSELVAIRQGDGGQAFQVNSSFNLADAAVSLRYKAFDDAFVSSDREGSGRLIANDASLRLNYGLGQWGATSINYERSTFEDGEHRELITPAFRHNLWRVNLSHELRMERTRNSERSNYRLLASLRKKALRGRLQVLANGDRADNLDMTTATASLEWQMSPEQRVNGRVRHGLRQHQSAASLGYSHDFGPVRLGMNLGVADGNDWSVGMSLNFGLGLEPDKGLSMIDPGKSSSGAVSINVSREAGAAGQGDTGAPMQYQENVGALINGRRHEGRTDSSGNMVLRGLPSHRPVKVELDLSSMQDPFMVADNPRVEIEPRPGQTQVLNFRLRDSASISGFLAGNRWQGGQPSVVATRHETGDVQTSPVYSDGYFSFELLSPGQWSIQLSQDAVPEGFSTRPLSVAVNSGEMSDGHELELIRADQGFIGEIQ